MANKRSDGERLRELLDKQDIAEVLYRYTAGADRSDVRLMHEAFWPDAQIDLGQGFVPVGQWQAGHGGGAPGKVSTHVLTNILAEFSDPGTAKVQSYFTSYHMRDDIQMPVFVTGRYIDLFVRRQGEWKILKRVLIYDWYFAGKSDPTLDAEAFPVGASKRNFGVSGPDDLWYASFA